MKNLAAGERTRPSHFVKITYGRQIAWTVCQSLVENKGVSQYRRRHAPSLIAVFLTQCFGDPIKRGLELVFDTGELASGLLHAEHQLVGGLLNNIRRDGRRLSYNRQIVD